MHSFETTSVTVAYRQACKDRVQIFECDSGVVIVVTDGAGGSGAGAQGGRRCHS